MSKLISKARPCHSVIRWASSSPLLPSLYNHTHNRKSLITNWPQYCHPSSIAFIVRLLKWIETRISVSHLSVVFHFVAHSSCAFQFEHLLLIHYVGIPVSRPFLLCRSSPSLGCHTQLFGASGSSPFLFPRFSLCRQILAGMWFDLYTVGMKEESFHSDFVQRVIPFIPKNWLSIVPLIYAEAWWSCSLRPFNFFAACGVYYFRTYFTVAERRKCPLKAINKINK